MPKRKRKRPTPTPTAAVRVLDRHRLALVASGHIAIGSKPEVTRAVAAALLALDAAP